MATFLTDEWIAELGAAAASLPGSDGGRFVVQQVVRDGDTEVAWRVVIDEVGVLVLPGRNGGADVTFTQDRETAEAIATGALNASTALVAGRLQVDGAVPALVAHRDTLLALDAAFAARGTDPGA